MWLWKYPHIYTHTVVAAYVMNSIHWHIYTATPFVHIIIAYKCTLVHITPELMIILSASNKQDRLNLLVVLSSFSVSYITTNIYACMH